MIMRLLLSVTFIFGFLLNFFAIAFPIHQNLCTTTSHCKLLIATRNIPPKVVKSKKHHRNEFNKLYESKSRDELEEWMHQLNHDKSAMITRGSDDDPLSEETWKELEEGQPSRWQVAKKLMGIGIHTYILLGLALLFLGLNAYLGPGWLGQMLGIPGTGSTTHVSDAIAETIDLSDPSFLLK